MCSLAKSRCMGQDLVDEYFELQICHENCQRKKKNPNSLLTYGLTRVEAGSNTSTVNLRVVRGDKMGLKKAAP
jgi:hypothetical protein